MIIISLYIIYMVDIKKPTHRQKKQKYTKVVQSANLGIPQALTSDIIDIIIQKRIDEKLMKGSLGDPLLNMYGKDILHTLKEKKSWDKKVRSAISRISKFILSILGLITLWFSLQKEFKKYANRKKLAKTNTKNNNNSPPGKQPSPKIKKTQSSSVKKEEDDGNYPVLNNVNEAEREYQQQVKDARQRVEYAHQLQQNKRLLANNDRKKRMLLETKRRQQLREQQRLLKPNNSNPAENFVRTISKKLNKLVIPGNITGNVSSSSSPPVKYAASTTTLTSAFQSPTIQNSLVRPSPFASPHTQMYYKNRQQPFKRGPYKEQQSPSSILITEGKLSPRVVEQILHRTNTRMSYNYSSILSKLLYQGIDTPKALNLLKQIEMSVRAANNSISQRRSNSDQEIKPIPEDDTGEIEEHVSALLNELSPDDEAVITTILEKTENKKRKQTTKKGRE